MQLIKSEQRWEAQRNVDVESSRRLDFTRDESDQDDSVSSFSSLLARTLRA